MWAPLNAMQVEHRCNLNQLRNLLSADVSAFVECKSWSACVGVVAWNCSKAYLWSADVGITERDTK
jgi:hypothetical protein